MPSFSLIQGSGRKRTGSYYTPALLIATLLDHALEPVIEERLSTRQGRDDQERALLSLRILDPACGPGHFLLAAARRLGLHLARLRSQGDDPPAEAYRLALRDVLRRCLHGVDRDPLAVELCRAGLWIEAGDPDLPLSFLDRQVRSGDSLLGDDLTTGTDPGPGTDPTPSPFPAGEGEPSPSSPPSPAGKGVGGIGPLAGKGAGGIGREGGRGLGASPFHWPLEFPGVFQSGGFDVVLGNPPFGNAIEAETARGAGEARLFALAYPEVARGAYDRANLFVARALQLLKPGGGLGMICPRATASGRGSRGLREYLAARTSLRMLWCPEDARLFGDADVFVCLVAARAGVSSPTVLVSTDPAGPGPTFREVPLLPPERGATWWELLHAHPDAPEPAPGSTVPLAAVAAVAAGCTTAVAYELAPAVEDSREGTGPRLITTGALDRFKSRWGARPVRYLKADYRFPRWPSEPASPGVARARERQRRPKLLVAGLSRVIEAAPDLEGSLAGVVSTHAVRPLAEGPEALLALLALLNSAAFSFLFFQRFGAKQLSGGNCTVGKRELLDTPLPADFPHWSSSRRASLGRAAVELARELCEREEGRGWSEADERLHGIVSSLYGLTPQQHAHVLDWWKRRAGRR